MVSSTLMGNGVQVVPTLSIDRIVIIDRHRRGFGSDSKGARASGWRERDLIVEKHRDGIDR
jgi:hypothetical protein